MGAAQMAEAEGCAENSGRWEDVLADPGVRLVAGPGIDHPRRVRDSFHEDSDRDCLARLLPPGLAAGLGRAASLK